MSAVTSGRAPVWFLRSYKDHDTHVAASVAVDIGTVTSRCGLTFTPVLHPIDGNPARLTAPTDELQICPRCCGGAT
ncbi:MAG: hypothetical protein JO296_12760 [Pseudonocardiales bacterium]|nr:hypothetical protein [Pseudonocardiales bacterium]